MFVSAIAMLFLDTVTTDIYSNVFLSDKNFPSNVEYVLGMYNILWLFFCMYVHRRYEQRMSTFLLTSPNHTVGVLSNALMLITKTKKCRIAKRFYSH